MRCTREHLLHKPIALSISAPELSQSLLAASPTSALSPYAGEDSDWPVFFKITPQLKPMHPLELFDRCRCWFGWIAPGRQLWKRNPDEVAPDRTETGSWSTQV